MHRYAIYGAPERATRLWHFGNRVLGRDAETGENIAQIVPPGFSAEEWHGFTASPRRYGFHATLKAPFALAPGRSEDELHEAVRAFAAAREPVTGIALTPIVSGGYVMLGLPQPGPRVQALAEACVSDFDAFRAPMPEADRARRGTGLSDGERRNLDRWGYPYVFDNFTFHLTLAGPFPDGRAVEAHAALSAAYVQAVKNEAFDLRSLCLFAEPEPGAPFSLILRVPFGAGA